ncbi:hypothetical protein GOV04_02700 [Candidatus Woesearchaeota archaeon]|nr:hypothetical protein [Candidatus Woesearchaeota archaeon]
MGQWSRTFVPIQQVLLNGGKMKLDDLVNKCVEIDPRRFRDGVSAIVDSIDDLSACLTLDDKGMVRFNKEAGSYSRLGLFERNIQYELHRSIKDMQDWELYPLQTTENSQTCYIGIKWTDLPEPDDGEPYILFCDYRITGDDKCSAGCRVSEDVLKSYGLLEEPQPKPKEPKMSHEDFLKMIGFDDLKD